MQQTQSLVRVFKSLFIGLLGGLLLASVSFSIAAQELAESADDSRLEEVRVTGSRIRRIDLETASPVLTISADDIIQAGFTSVQDVLADLPQNSGGSLDQQQVFGFTPSASGVDLRGAGLGRSLTLINGKRTPKYPVAAGGTDNFVDTSNIPLGAIERIEVLTSAGSAIYGSDAMGGVVNVILKDTYNGVEFKVKHGDTTHGGREINNVSLLGGTSGDDSSIMFFLEHETSQVLHASQRNNFNDIGSDLAFGVGDYSSYGISLRNAYTNALLQTLDADECSARGLQPRADSICGFNRSSRRDLFPELERTSSLISFKRNIGIGQFYSRIDYTHGTARRDIEPMPVSDYTYFVDLDASENPDPGFVTLSSDLTGSTARYDKNVAFGGDFSTALEGVYYPTRRMIEFGNRQTYSETDNYSFLTGLEGEFKNWRWDLDWMFARTAFRDWSYGYAREDLYFNYLTSGGSGHSVFDEIYEDDVSEAAYIPWKDAQSNFTGFSGMMDGEILNLPAGPVSLAFGFESYREWFYNTSDTESRKNNILSTGGSSGQGDRSYDALFVESLIPIIKSFSATVALRYDNYSDFGSNVAPQFSFEYRPVENLLVRGLWAETFRAPDMQRVYGDATVAFQQIYDPYSCQQQGGVVGGDDAVSTNTPACNGELYVDVSVGPNAELDAETGKNANVGVVYNTESFDISFDYWEMDIEDIVNDLKAQEISSNYDIYADLIERTASGDIEKVNAIAQNLSFRNTAGIDFKVGYQYPLADLGLLRLKFNGSYLLMYDEQFSQLTPTEDQMDVDRVPKLRTQLSGSWEYNNVSTTLYINHIGDMNGTNRDDMDESFEYPTTIDSQIKMNWSASYRYRGMKSQVGVNNLTDEGPNPDYTDNGWPYYPQEYYNAIGREYYVSLSYAFE